MLLLLLFLYVVYYGIWIELVYVDKNVDLIWLGDGVEEANGYEKYETELFEDTLVIRSPFTETEVEMINLNDTEIVEDSEPVEDMTAKCEYETEVVLDSEDEEMNNAGKVTVGERFLQDESSPAVSNLSVLFRKRLSKIPCVQANSKSNAASSGKSGTGMCLFITI